LKALSSTRNPGSNRFAPGAWQGLVRKLVQQAASGKSHAKNSPDGSLPSEVVIFDGNVDGVRCLLLRQHSAEEPSVTFSPREREIARMIAKGLPNKTIAGVLDISTWTVCTHLRRIFSKLGVSSRAAMVARMMEKRQLEDPKSRSSTKAASKAIRSRVGA
jgi:two-component system, NarL family, nitrate/nitrite response regulator NarL